MGGNSGNCATVVRDLLTNQKDMITRIDGDINPKTHDILKEEIDIILFSIKSTPYDQGSK